MQLTRTAYACAFAAVAISVVTVGTASATSREGRPFRETTEERPFREEPPEFGQCLPKPFAGVGNWKDAGCTVPKGPGLTEHRYEWYPGFGENGAHDPPRLITAAKFKSKIKRGTLAIFEVDHIKKVTCTGETAIGEITGPKTVGNVVSTFTGCTEVSGNTCQTKGGPPGSVILTPFQGELGTIKESSIDPSKNQIGLVLFIGEVEFECANISLTVTGSIIHPLTANVMGLSSTERFTGHAGKQVPGSFEFLQTRAEQKPPGFRLPPRRDVLETSLGEGPFTESSLSLASTQRYGMKIEVSSIS
jgi:hypothetical protein